MNNDLVYIVKGSGRKSMRKLIIQALYNEFDNNLIFQDDTQPYCKQRVKTCCIYEIISVEQNQIEKMPM